MVLADSAPPSPTLTNDISLSLPNTGPGSKHSGNPSTAEFAALEAQFFEYNQISDTFGSFGGYDMMHLEPTNDFGLSLDLMNLPPPSYTPSHTHPTHPTQHPSHSLPSHHSHSHVHHQQHAQQQQQQQVMHGHGQSPSPYLSSVVVGGPMDASPLYSPMEMGQENAHGLHSYGHQSQSQSQSQSQTQSQGGHGGIHPSQIHMHPSQMHHPHPHPHSHPHSLSLHLSHVHSQSQGQGSQTPLTSSPLALMSNSDLSAGALSSACSSAGSPEECEDQGAVPSGQSQSQSQSQSPSSGQGQGQNQGQGQGQGSSQGQGGQTQGAQGGTKSHGRTSHTAEKVRYNPMRGARAGSAGASNSNSNSSVVSSNGPSSALTSSTVPKGRKRNGSVASLASVGSVGSGVSGGNGGVKPKEEDSDDDDLDYAPVSPAKADKREEIRKQRIESEQRRRDELREGYRRLKEALPSSNQKSSKVALLDRAVNHVRYMEMTRQQLQVRLNAAEMEMARLRQVNEALMLGTAEQRAAAVAASAAVQAHVQPQY